MQDLLAAEPENPYFHELYGQILFEYGRLEEALPAFQRAFRLAQCQLDVT